MTFTPTKHRRRCVDCGRLFVVSMEALEGTKLADIIYCQACVTGDPVPEELALDIQVIGSPEHDPTCGVCIVLPTYDHYVALVEGLNSVPGEKPLQDKSAALRHEILEAAWEHGV